MRLDSFSVENYRSITEARQIKLSNSTTLIGPNNEGKSNILRALSTAMYALSKYSQYGRRGLDGRFFLGQRDDENAHTYSWIRDFPLSLRKSRSIKQTKITLNFLLSEAEISDFKREIKSSLNGILPVCVVFDTSSVEINIVKQGKGSKGLNSKSGEIARFLANRIQFQYIPAIRTAQHASRIVENIIASELAEIEKKSEYQQALSAIRDLQKPVLEKFSQKTTDTLKSFLPSVKSVTFSISETRRYSALRQSIDVDIDDGTITRLEAKGDGVQSLVALGLRRHLLEESREQRTYIFAVEEPEAHLHPDAIHQLKEVLNDVARVDQLIITTHCGILANRENISSNIIVQKSKAVSAKNLASIRSALGIKSKDNLINSDLVLLVEGDDDKLALRAVLANLSPDIDRAFKMGRLTLDSLDGAGALAVKVGLYRNILCRVHCFLDNDDAGRGAIERAKRAGILDESDYHLTILSTNHDSEFEDLVNPMIYKDLFLDRFGIDLSITKSRVRSNKWSARMADIFLQSGKPFDDMQKQRAKLVVAEAVAGSPATAIVPHAQAIIDNLSRTLLAKLGTAS